MKISSLVFSPMGFHGRLMTKVRSRHSHDTLDTQQLIGIVKVIFLELRTITEPAVDCTIP